jgi:hypothetical protein
VRSFAFIDAFSVLGIRGPDGYWQAAAKILQEAVIFAPADVTAEDGEVRQATGGV